LGYFLKNEMIACLDAALAIHSTACKQPEVSWTVGSARRLFSCVADTWRLVPSAPAPSVRLKSGHSRANVRIQIAIISFF
jgi:hypothetical protein